MTNNNGPKTDLRETPYQTEEASEFFL